MHHRATVILWGDDHPPCQSAQVKAAGSPLQAPRMPLPVPIRCQMSG
jgi:hypothetical protein